jgi:putative N6-adenine-specific DNA methylase
VRVRATSKKSRIYHSGAIAERISGAIEAGVGCELSDDDDAIQIQARFVKDLCTLSIDLSGAPLYQRGYKLAVGKAPMRESLAAAFLIDAGWHPDEPLVDPMCGSGTFVLEAALRARGIAPGAQRNFAFERLVGFDQEAWDALRQAEQIDDVPYLYGSDRDAGAITSSKANAERAGIADHTHFARHAVSDLQRPEGPTGLVICNPPYGERIGNQKELERLYSAFGDVLKRRFSGWRVAMVTSDRKLAHATRLPFKPPSAPVPHGGLRVQLYQTRPLVPR